MQMTNGIGTSGGDAASVADGRTPVEKGNAMADKEPGQAVCVSAISYRSSSRAA